MNEAVTPTGSRSHPLWVKLLAGLALVAVLLALLVVFFPWDLLRGPLNRYVSERTGRHFEITRRLDVKVGRNTRILADGIEFANPEWAQDPHLVKAQSAEIQVELLPLLKRQIVLPLILLREPQLGLQMEADGRRSWALGRDSSDPRNIPDIGALVVDQGTMHFVATHHGADIHTQFAIQGASPSSGNTTTATASMPLTFNAKGTWQKEPFTAKGRTGNVLYLSAPLQQPFPIEVDASAGRTTLRATGAIASLATLDGADAVFNLQGQDLADLYKLVGVVLPATPRYALRGHVSKQGEVWQVRQINGKLGNSDLGGELSFNRAQKVPLLTGKLTSNSLDFDDLAPLVGLPEQPRSAAALPQVGGPRPAPGAQRTRTQPDPGRKLLPTAALDLARLKAMNSDVSYSAARITHAKQLPLERMSVHVRLNNGVLQLDKMNLGVAGGNVAGQVRIDGNTNPAVAQANLDVRSLELGKLFPGAQLTKASFGKIHGDIDLKGRGNSVAQMLGASSGNVALLMGPGQISNLLLEIAGIDGAEILKFLSSGDKNVLLRCAAAAFDVNSGLMSSRALVLDTTDTVIYGEGAVNLANEAMDLTLRPYPKDMSILSLRSPLKLAGTFAAPKAGPDKGALASRAGVALALGAVNPLLALAATVETGPGKDANCGAILREAASPDATARAAVMSQHGAAEAARKRTSRLGAAAAPPANRSAGADDPAARDKTAPLSPQARQHAPVDPSRPYGP
jgi:AsmA family protein